MKQFFLTLLNAHKDKIYHFFCSYTAMLTFTAIAIIKWESPITWSVNFGIAMAILVGVAKEFFDLYVKKSKFSVGDIIADGLGIAIAFLIVGV
jgi:VanZ family protein